MVIMLIDGGSFGDDFKRFLIGIGDDYLINKLGGSNSYIFDFDDTIKNIKKEILEYRRDGNSAEKVREIWDEIECLESTNNKDIFFRDIMDTKYYDIICCNEPYNIIVEDIVNPPLNSFVKEIWPHFINALKKEKNDGH